MSILSASVQRNIKVKNLGIFMPVTWENKAGHSLRQERRETQVPIAYGLVGKLTGKITSIRKRKGWDFKSNGKAFLFRHIRTIDKAFPVHYNNIVIWRCYMEEPMEEKSSTTLENIFRAAMEEFSERGFLGASLRQIVKRAGVTTGAVSYTHLTLPTILRV